MQLLFLLLLGLLLLLFCVDNIIKLSLKICFFDIKAALIAIVCGCVISGGYSVIKCVLFVIIAVFVFLFLLFLPLLFLLSFVLLCLLLIL